MSCPGAGHCASCAGGVIVPVLPLAAIYGLAWLAEHLVEVIVTSAACGVLSVAAVVALTRWTRRREEMYAASRPLLYARAEPVQIVTATIATPQVSRGTAPAIHNHYGPQFIINGTDGQETAARLIRQALTGAVPDYQEIRP